MCAVLKGKKLVRFMERLGEFVTVLLKTLTFALLYFVSLTENCLTKKIVLHNAVQKTDFLSLSRIWVPKQLPFPNSCCLLLKEYDLRQRYTNTAFLHIQIQR